MRTSIKNTYNEIKEAYKPTLPSKKVHGEEVIRFIARVQWAVGDRSFEFDAPQCSSNYELERHACLQNKQMQNIIDWSDWTNISYRTI